MRSPLLTVLLAAALPALLTPHCVSLNRVSGGSGSETVIGRVENTDGTPAGSAIVALYPETHDPFSGAPIPMSSIDTCDGSGSFSVRAPDTAQRYRILAINPANGTRALSPAVLIRDDTTTVSELTLREPGAIRMAAPENADLLNGYLFIPGTNIAAPLSGGSGLTFIDQVPAGIIPAVCYASRRAAAEPTIIRSNLEIVPGDTVVIPYPEWRYSRKLSLNTTSSGAGISNAVSDFPVLVRLSSSTFSFEQALPDGEDLRFTSENGARLPSEIELWDRAGSSAAIWVRTETIRGNDASQYIVMHWGASTTSPSNSAAVFDTAAGFQGVWHLAGSGNETAYDATPNGYNGTAYGMGAASAVEGIIGTARDFNGSSGYIAMLNTASGRLSFPEDGAYAISLWAYADTIDTLWHAIAGKGHEQYYLKLKCFGNGRATWEFVEFQDLQGWEYTEDSVPPAPGRKQWVYLTGVRSGARQYLYINGVMVNDSTPLMTGNFPRNSGDDFFIGRHARQVTIPYFEGWCYFNGKIDEVRVMSFSPSPDWIRLCYMNQKAEDALVEFR